MITYENQNGKKIRGVRSWDINVRLDGKIVGEIKSLYTGYGYKPTGIRNIGEVFETLADVKRSLED